MTVRVCFDSSLWNALFNQEEDKDLSAVQSWIQQIDTRKATLLIPSIVVTEVFAHPDEVIVKKFDAFLSRSNVEQLDLTVAIARKGGQLRRRLLDANMNLKTPDAIVIAIADHHSADKIFSFDHGMLRCNGLFGIQAKICLPSDGHEHPLFDQ